MAFYPRTLRRLPTGCYLPANGLQNWRWGTGNLRNIVCVGDSLTQGSGVDAWPTRLRRRLSIEDGGYAGSGLYHCWRSEWAFAGGTWLDAPTSWAGDKGPFVTKYHDEATDGGPGVTATFTVPAADVAATTNYLNLYWVAGGLLVIGNWRYSIDGGGSWVNIDTASPGMRDGSFALRKTAINTTGATLIVQASSSGVNTVGVSLAGVEVVKGAVTYGTRVHNVGAGGQYLATFMRAAPSPLGIFEHIKPDLVTVMFSNDVLLNPDPTGFITNLFNLVAGVRLFFNPATDFVFICPPEQGGNRATLKAAQANYRARTVALAASLPGVAAIDLREAWGPLESAKAAGLMSGDDVHPTDAGHADIAWRVGQLIA